MHEVQFDEAWDKKKIAIALAAIIILISAGIYAKVSILDKNKPVQEEVKGTHTQVEAKREEISSRSAPNFSSPDLQSEFQKRLESVKKEIGDLSLLEVASSSPQIQKILKDIHDLQQVPGTQVKSMCENICKGL